MPILTPERCPAIDLLDRFCAGNVSEDELEDVSEHLTQCPTCVERLHSLSSQFALVASPSSPIWPGHETELSAKEIRLVAARIWNTDVPDRIGKYPIKRQLAVGGMGVVYLAWHPSLMCEVVVKTIKPQKKLQASATNQMLEEQRALGKIRHPCIVAVLDADTDEGLPFIVMERVPGVTLSDFVSESVERNANTRAPQRGLLWRDVCQIGHSIAIALDQLHRAGLVHRDVKPSNVMVDTVQNVKLLDLGLVLNLSEDLIDGHSHVVGTPQFASPEQASGVQVDARSDLYALGATLSFMLHGNTSIDSPSMSRGSGCEDNRWPAALVSLIEELLQPRPGDRPQSARAVADRLESLPRNHRERLIPGWATLLASGLFALALIAIWATLSPTKPSGRQRLSEQLPANQLFVRPTLENFGPLPVGLPANFDTQLPRPGVLNASRSRDGRYLACFGTGGNLRIYAVDTATPELVQVVRCYKHTNVNDPQVNWLDQDQAIAVTGAGYDPVLIWDIPSKRFRCQIESSSEITASHVDPSGNQLVLASQDGWIRSYDSYGSMAWEVKLPEEASPTEVMWSHDASSILVATGGSRLWEIKNGIPRSHDFPTMSAITALVPMVGGGWMLGDQDGHVHQLDGQLNETQSFTCSDQRVDQVLSLSPLAHAVVTAAGIVRIDLKTATTQVILGEPIVRGKVVDADDKQAWVLSAGDIRQRTFADSTKSAWILKCVNQSVHAVAFHPQDEQIAVCLSNQVVLVNTAGELVWHDRKRNTTLQEMNWSPGGGYLAAVAGWGGKALLIWQSGTSSTAPLRQLHEINAPKAVTSLSWLDDGRILTAGEDGIVRSWSALSGDVIRRKQLQGFVRSIRVSADRKRIAIGYQRDGLMVMDTEFNTLAKLDRQGSLAAIRALRWHPQKDQLAAINESRYVDMFRGSDLTLLSSFHSPWSKPTALAWKNDADQLAISPLGMFELHSDGTLVSQRNEIRTRCMDWSQDGSMRVVGDTLSAVHFYRGEQHCWTMLFDRPNSAITVDHHGQVLDRWNLSLPLVR